MAHLRRPRSTVLTIVLLQLVALAALYYWYTHRTPLLPDAPQRPPPPPPPPPPSPAQPKVHVLLLSSWGSGSSLLGQVFSQSPSVFYLMEPLWPVREKQEMPGAQVLRSAVRDLLQQVLKCDMSAMDSYLPPEAKVSNLFMWSHSRALCSPPLCSLTPPGGFSNQTECERHCNSSTISAAMDTCRNHSHVVLRTVRIFDLESLYPLLQDPALNLRIIHLVRDPRATWQSRQTVGQDLVRDNEKVLQQSKFRGIEADYHAMEAVCKSQVRIHQTALRDPPAFLRGRYKMVRYEDVADDPLGQVEDSYQFVGLTMSRRMQLWTFRATYTNARFSASSRNANTVSRKWRTLLAYEQVQRIQRICKDAMSLIGYRPVVNITDQQDIKRDVVLPRELNSSSGTPLLDNHDLI